ncbi:MAG: hypothetical protein ACREE7_06815, partial [Dongiaceae bacterium]
MGLNLAALLWGFAEATLFFIVPDVLLTALAIWRGRRVALIAAIWAVAGALIGGAVMRHWGAADPAGAAAAVAQVPAISASSIAASHGDMAADGLMPVLVGGFAGAPYKTFAIGAPSAGIGIAAFLLVSLVARGARFALAVLVADQLNRK